MAIVTPLYNHNSFETAYCVNDYPYGRLRTKMYFWLDTHPKRGVRLVMQSVNPKTGRLNKPKMGIYSAITENLFLDENGHCKSLGINEYSSSCDVIEFIKNFPENHNMDTLKVWCLTKYRYLRAVVESKEKPFRINGVVEKLEGSELERYQTEMREWWQAYLMAAKKPLDTAEPELKKKD